MKMSWIAVPLLLGVAGQTCAMTTFRDASTTQQLFCSVDEIRSDFSSPAQVTYRARGFCSMKEAGQSKPAGSSTFDNYNNATELYRFRWTSTGSYNPTTKVAKETVEAPPPRIDEPSPRDRPYGRFTLDTLCDIDPWLKVTSLRCAPAKTAVTGNLSDAVRQALAHGSVPFTSNMSFAMRDIVRAAQRKEDERLAALARMTPTLTEARAMPGATSTTMPLTAPATLGKRKLPAAQPTGGAGGSAPPAAAATPAPTPSTAPPVNAQLAPPRIVTPLPAARIALGQLKLQVQPHAGAEHGPAEVELMSVPTTPQLVNAPSPSARRFSAPIEQLAQGLLVPAGAAPSEVGRWRVRVRMGASGQGAWSEAVLFDVVPAADKTLAGAANKLDHRGLNPQPLPPKQAKAWGQRDGDLDRRGLNPQPLPPKEGTAPRSAFERQ